MDSKMMQKGMVYMDSSYNMYYPPGASMVDGLPEDLESVLPEIWKKFPPQHPLIIHVVALLYILLWIVNAVGNWLVMYIFMTTKTLRTPTNMLVVNLAFSDFCMMTTMGLPVSINAVVSNKWIWGAPLCRVYGAVGALFGTVSLVTMVVIGYDRYNVIVKGIKGKRLTPCKALCIIVGIWTYCLGGCIPPYFGWGGYALDGLLITCNYDYYNTDWNKLSFTLYAFVTHYLLPMSCVVFFYSQIIRAVVAHENALKKQAKKMNVDSLRSASGGQDGGGASSAEIRVAKVAITNVSLWAFIWTPFAAVCVLALCGQLQLITPLVAQVPAFFAKIASCLNPLVYAISHPKYREALSERIPCLGIRERPEVDASDGTQMVTTAALETA